MSNSLELLQLHTFSLNYDTIFKKLTKHLIPSPKLLSLPSSYAFLNYFSHLFVCGFIFYILYTFIDTCLFCVFQIYLWSFTEILYNIYFIAYYKIILTYLSFHHLYLFVVISPFKYNLSPLALSMKVSFGRNGHILASVPWHSEFNFSF